MAVTTLPPAPQSAPGPVVDDDDVALTLAQAAKLPMLLVSRGGKPAPPNPSTIWRWATVGIRGVKLRTRRIGGTTTTTAADVRAFIDAINSDEPAAPSASTPAQSRRAHQAAAKALDAANVR